MTAPDGLPGVGELQRSLQATLTRFENLATEMRTQFVQKELFKAHQRMVDEIIQGIRESIRLLSESKETHATKEQLSELRGFADTRASKSEVIELRKDVENIQSNMQDNQKWLQRLVIGVLLIALAGFFVDQILQRAGGG